MIEIATSNDIYIYIQYVYISIINYIYIYNNGRTSDDS